MSKTIRTLRQSPSPTTTERTWEKLVRAKMKCPDYYEMKPGDGGSCTKDCPHCNGTGSVPVLPGLREKCGGQFAPPHSKECMNCHGAPWVAKPKDMPLLLAEMRRAGFERMDSNYMFSFYPSDGFGDDRYPVIEVTNGDDFAACVKAARLAVEAKHPQKVS